jgi:hypothetical protein
MANTDERLNQYLEFAKYRHENGLGWELHVPGKPCYHRGCMNHVSEPCEGCERFGAIDPVEDAAQKAIEARELLKWLKEQLEETHPAWEIPTRTSEFLEVAEQRINKVLDD